RTRRDHFFESTGRVAAKQPVPRGRPYVSLRIHHDMANAVALYSLRRASLTRARIQMQQAARGSADPQRAIRSTGTVPDHVDAVHWLLLPHQPSVMVLSVVQTELRSDPQTTGRIARYRPDRFAREPFAFAPALPLVVAEPSREPGPEQSQPDGSFTILH